MSILSSMYKTLLFVSLLFALAEGVIIRNYSGRGCTLYYKACYDIPSHKCCSARARPYASSHVAGIIDSEVKLICSGVSTWPCRAVLHSTVGSGCISPIGPTQQARGSMWFSCLRGCTSKAAVNTNGDVITQYSDPNVDVSSDNSEVEPDKIVFDGHVFDINYHVPANATAQLEDLAEAMASYADIPQELLQYEVTNSVAQELLSGN